MFNFESLQHNLYALPVLAAAVVVGLLGLTVLFLERASTVGWLFLCLTVSVSIYFFCAGVSYLLADPAVLIWWERMANAGVTTVPLSVLAATLGILGRVRKHRAGLLALVAVSLFFVVFVLSSDLFIRSTRRLFWGYYPVYGPLGIAFIFYFAVVMVTILLTYWREYRGSTNTLHRRRLGGILIAFAVGYLGAVDFLPAVGIPVYAFGYVFVLIFVAIIAFVILKYRLVDITPALASEQILHTMQGAVLVTDLLGTIRIANRVAHEIFTGPLIGQRLDSVLSLPPSRDGADGTQLSVTDYEIELFSGTDRERRLSVSVSPLIYKKAGCVGGVCVALDITDRKKAEQRLKRLALYDPLTDLPNRVLFSDRLAVAIRHARRNGGELAILYMDLDRFKEVNDRFGHEVGDEVLRNVAQRIQSGMRSSDTVARLGGDEFIGVCSGVASIADAESIAAKIIGTLEQPFSVDGVSCNVGISIGISLYPIHGEDEKALVARADEAMYRAKSAGRGGYAAFSMQEEG
jgi:diguanylate cyclase (GGDEF)-like protein